MKNPVSSVNSKSGGPDRPGAAINRLLPKYENALTVILNLIQNLIKIMRYETLKQVQGDNKQVQGDNKQVQG
ncbi:MAG TPA: hypothetical protein ENH38_10495 [Nitrospirae bacterium]|nr:hypothetical protein [Nitrospirota bacterium]